MIPIFTGIQACSLSIIPHPRNHYPYTLRRSHPGLQSTFRIKGSTLTDIQGCLQYDLVQLIQFLICFPERTDILVVLETCLSLSFCCSVTQLCLTLRLHGLQDARLPYPSPSPYPSPMLYSMMFSFLSQGVQVLLTPYLLCDISHE